MYVDLTEVLGCGLLSYKRGLPGKKLNETKPGEIGRQREAELIGTCIDIQRERERERERETENTGRRTRRGTNALPLSPMEIGKRRK